MKKIGYIYKVTNIITNEAYIGQTNNYKERQRSHKRMEGNCWKFYDAITQYGLDNFKWEILEECLITELKQMLVSTYKLNVDTMRVIDKL